VECTEKSINLLLVRKTEMSIYTSLTPKPDALIRHSIGVH